MQHSFNKLAVAQMRLVDGGTNGNYILKIAFNNTRRIEYIVRAGDSRPWSLHSAMGHPERWEVARNTVK